MLLRKLFPYPLMAGAAFCMLSLSTAAQTTETRPRLVGQFAESLTAMDLGVLADEPIIISVATPEDIKAAKAIATPGQTQLRFEQVISAAIDERLGSPYSWGAAGPSAFDCSGFVWSTFHAVGIDFERASARTLWTRFAPPAPEEQYKFGTLVFFSGLAHVGIVADEYGFYHASRHHGVIYSPFNEYWLARVDGFRRVHVAAATTAN